MPTLAWALLGYVTTMSVIAAVINWKDKRASGRGAWRTSERTLHALDLLGGWPGGVLARRALRHKSRKPGFRAITALIVALHLLALCAALWLLFHR